MSIPDYRDPRLTEQRNPRTERIDVASSLEIVDLLNAEDATVAGAVHAVRGELARAIDLVVDAFGRGGRLIYVGAGTSGRLGVLDASECPPTFGTPPEMVVGENPPEGALLTFWIGEPSGERVEIEIANAQGQPVARFKLPEVPGLTRFAWNLRPTADLMNEYGGLGKDRLLPGGEYRVEMKHGKAKQAQKLRVNIAEGIETR